MLRNLQFFKNSNDAACLYLQLVSKVKMEQVDGVSAKLVFVIMPACDQIPQG